MLVSRFSFLGDDPQRKEATSKQKPNLRPGQREELDSVIRRPASLHNVRFEEGLAVRILNDAGVEPSTLPLLEFALTELGGRQTERTLTQSRYEQIGQLSGAIAQRAEKVIRSLTPPYDSMH